jgi:streptomycin 6-kinase
VFTGQYGTVGGLVIPQMLARAARLEGRDDWLVTLPPIISQAAEKWSLTVGEPYQPGGHTAWVAPARDRLGRPLALKVAWWHPEASHEAAGLHAWNGNGAVQLHAVMDLADTVVLLLERCEPGTPLSDVTETEQDGVVAGLLHRLWTKPPPGHSFRPLAQMCQRWAGQFEQEAAAGHVPIDPGLARAGITLFRELPATTGREVLLCTDLHAGNVLAAQREPWLAIDPKPYVGDPHYDVLQHMLNCGERLAADPVGFAHRMAGLAGLDHHRLLLWLFARCVQESPGWPPLANIARRIAPA